MTMSEGGPIPARSVSEAMALSQMTDRYPTPTSPVATAAMKANRRADTKPELAVRSILHRRGLRFWKDHLIRAGDVSVKADIVFPRRGVAVFIDGCWWHRCPEHGDTPRANADYWIPKFERNVRRDKIVSEALRADGWTVLRIWEHVSPGQAADEIDSIVRGGQRQLLDDGVSS